MKLEKIKITATWTVSFYGALLLILLMGLCFPSGLMAGNNEISERQLKKHVDHLASPKMEGRLAPGPGSEKAQVYIASLFKKYGLKELPDVPGYRQSIPLQVSRTDYENSRLTVHHSEQATEFLPDKDYFFYPKGGKDADITGNLLLVGYGIRAPELGYDDFQNVNATDKFLLVFNREPQESDSASVFNGAKPSKYSQVQVKARIARELGARGLLIMQPPREGLPPIEATLERYRKTQNDPIIQLKDGGDDFPVVYLTATVVRALLGDDFDITAYHNDIDDHFKSHTVALDNCGITFSPRFNDVQQASTANIVGYYPGQTDEVVLVMAHHDHLGIVGGALHPGADDNASGTSGLLEIARVFSQLGVRNRRGILFLSTGAEEEGMLGAIYFTRHLPIAGGKIVAALNMDCIGRDASTQFRAMFDSTLKPEPNSLMIFYSGQTPELDSLSQRKNETTKLNLTLEPVLDFSSASDHIHFHALHTPTMFFFTGFHRDYHTPGDTPDKLNYEKMTRVVRFVYHIAKEIAQAPQRPLFDTTIKEVKGTGRKYGG